MVQFQVPINVNEHAGQGGSSVLIPQGQYQAIVAASEMKETKKGGQMVVFTIVVTQGPHAHTEFKEQVNIVNDNPKAVEIGYQTIANIGKAVGLEVVSASEELHNRPIMIEVKNKLQDDWTNDKGETVKGKERSEIDKYHALPASGVPAQPAAPAQPVETAPAQTAAAPTAPATAPVENPFAPPAS